MSIVKSGFDELFSISKNKFAVDSIYLFFMQFILAVSAILNNIIIGNAYGSEGLGVFNQVVAFYFIASTFAALGLNNATLKHASVESNDKSELKYLLSTNLYITLISSSIISTIIFLSTIYTPFLYSNNLVARSVTFISVALPFFGINKNLLSYLNALRQIKLFSIIRSLRWILLLIVLLIFTRANVSIEYTPLVFAISEIFLTIALIIINKDSIGFSFSRKWAKISLSFGIQSFLAEILSISNDKVDLLIIGYLLSVKEVGIYSFAVSIARGILQIPVVFLQNFNPIVAKLWAENKKEQLNGYVKKIKKFSLIILLPSWFLISILYYILINYIMINEYADSFFIFLVLSIGIFIFSNFSWTGLMLIMGGFLKQNLIRILFMLIFSTTSLFIITSSLGLWGATIATSINFIVFSIIQILALKKIMGINVLNS